MDFKDFKRIVELIKDHEIAEMDLQDGEFHLSLRLRGSEPVYVQAPAMAAAPAPAPGAAAPVPLAAAPAAPGPSIKSPMVGTFYRSGSPDAEAFAKVGDVVGPDTTVCIIEAMKVMNEIKAEMKGKITRVLVDNAEAVEFGQPLFEIEPA